MIPLGVAGVVALGLIAIYQGWAAATYRTAAFLYQRLYLATSRRDEANRRRLFVVGDALGRARSAVARCDFEGLTRALGEATEEVRAARRDDEALVRELQATVIADGGGDRPVTGGSGGEEQKR